MKIDFIKALASCRVEGTQLPFFPEKIKGYTEEEVNLIAHNYNLDIHGQFREFLLQMGKCSGGLLWGNEFYIYDVRKNSATFMNYQHSEKADLGYVLTNQGKIDPVEKKMFFLTCEYETYFYYLFTADQDDYVWMLHDIEDGLIVKTNETLLEHLKYYVSYKTKNARFIDFNLTEEKINQDISGRLL